MPTLCEKCGRGLKDHYANYECMPSEPRALFPTDYDRLYKLLNEDLPPGVEAAYMSTGEVRALLVGDLSTINIGYDVGPKEVYVAITLPRNGKHAFNVRAPFDTETAPILGSLLKVMASRIKRFWAV